MDSDTALNLIALVAPLLVVCGGIAAYLRIEDALEHRAWLAKMRRKPFHPTQIQPEKRREVGIHGQTPGLWHLERSVDFALGRTPHPPSWLDYMQEFHPENLKR